MVTHTNICTSHNIKGYFWCLNPLNVFFSMNWKWNLVLFIAINANFEIWLIFFKAFLNFVSFFCNHMFSAHTSAKENHPKTHISKVIALFVSTTAWQSGGNAPYCKTAISTCWVMPKLPSGRWAAHFYLSSLSFFLYFLSAPVFMFSLVQLLLVFISQPWVRV